MSGQAASSFSLWTWSWLVSLVRQSRMLDGHLGSLDLTHDPTAVCEPGRRRSSLSHRFLFFLFSTEHTGNVSAEWRCPSGFGAGANRWIIHIMMMMMMISVLPPTLGAGNDSTDWTICSTTFQRSILVFVTSLLLLNSYMFCLRSSTSSTKQTSPS